jgi:hypothetical protein
MITTFALLIDATITAFKSTAICLDLLDVPPKTNNWLLYFFALGNSSKSIVLCSTHIPLSLNTPNLIWATVLLITSGTTNLINP